MKRKIETRLKDRGYVKGQVLRFTGVRDKNEKMGIPKYLDGLGRVYIAIENYPVSGNLFGYMSSISSKNHQQLHLRGCIQKLRQSLSA